MKREQVTVEKSTFIVMATLLISAGMTLIQTKLWAGFVLVVAGVFLFTLREVLKANRWRFA